jgi:hypothetical protein
MVIVATKTKAAHSAMIKTKITPIQICRLILLMIVWCLIAHHAKARRVKVRFGLVTRVGQKSPYPPLPMVR